MTVFLSFYSNGGNLLRNKHRLPHGEGGVPTLLHFYNHNNPEVNCQRNHSHLQMENMESREIKMGTLTGCFVEI